jgi:hypothetical protein
LYRRTVLCLLAPSLLILAHPALIGQSAAVYPAPLPAHTPLEFAPEHFTPEYIRVPSPITPSPPISLPTPVSFPGIARAAGLIFSGTVKSVERRSATRGSAVKTVQVTFHVDDAIRGATSGEDLSISQWDWPLDEQSALSRRRTGSPISLSAQQAGPDQFCSRTNGAIQCGCVGPCPAFRPPSFCVSNRSRPWWEAARSYQRLRLGGAEGL